APPGGQAVIVGGVTSTVYVNTWAQVDVFRQPSVAVYILVRVLPHPLDWMLSVPTDLVTAPQASVAVNAFRSAPGIVGLHPNAPPGGQAVIVGGVTSTVYVNTWAQV